MKFKRVAPSSFIVRFERGDEIVQGLLGFAKKAKLKSAWISGLGGLATATIGFYNVKRKTYRKKTRKNMELTALTGNLCRVKNNYALHAHATLSDRSCKAFGGHLFKGIVSATCEVFITEIRRIERKMDLKIGLNLMRLK